MNYQNERDANRAVANFNRNAGNMPNGNDSKTTGAPANGDSKNDTPTPKSEYGK
jgi:hypothetical protein